MLSLKEPQSVKLKRLLPQLIQHYRDVQIPVISVFVGLPGISVEIYSKNKFEKLVHLVGFIVRICDFSVPFFPPLLTLLFPFVMNCRKTSY